MPPTGSEVVWIVVSSLVIGCSDANDVRWCQFEYVCVCGGLVVAGWLLPRKLDITTAAVGTTFSSDSTLCRQASLYDMLCFTSCTFFSSFHPWQSLLYAGWGPEQFLHLEGLEHCSWWCLSPQRAQTAADILTVSLLLTIEAAQRVGNIYLNFDPDISNLYLFRSDWRVESEYIHVCWMLLAVFISHFYIKAVCDSLVI